MTPPAAIGPYVQLVLTGEAVRVSGQRAADFGHPPGGGTHDLADPFARWRVTACTLNAVTDRYGAYPIYWWVGPRQIALASRVDTLLALGTPTDLDWEALAVFVRLGFYLGDSTCLRAVRVLPPGARLTWHAGELSIRSRPPIVEPVSRSQRAAVDGFTDRFREAIRRRPPAGRFLLPLSGGRDSRHILLELVRQGHPPAMCVTGAKFAPDDAGDVATARRVARAVGVRHVTVGRPRSQLAAELAASSAQGLTTIEGGWTLPLLDVLRRGTGATYDGIGGDMLTGRLTPRLVPGLAFDMHDLTGLADRLLAAGRYDAYLPMVLTGRLGRALGRDRAVAGLAAELGRHVDQPSPWVSFFFNRTRRAVAQTPFGLYRGRPVVRAPFLDGDVFDFLFSIPAAERDPGLHDEVIRRGYPAFAGLPYATGGPGHGPTFVRHRLQYLAQVLAHDRSGPTALRDRQGSLVSRLMRGARSEPGLRALNRLLPMTVYLDQVRERSPWDPAWETARA